MNNKENLQYFECSSMRGLYNEMKGWQEKHQKRLLSTDIQQDGELFTCIALTNPTEVVLCNPHTNVPLNVYNTGDGEVILGVSVRYQELGGIKR